MKKLLYLLLALLTFLPYAIAQDDEATVKWSTKIIKTSSGYEMVVSGTPSYDLAEPGDGTVHGTINWISCYGNACHSPEECDFEFDLSKTEESETKLATDSQSSSVEPVSNSDAGSSLWSLILEAILWGFAMLLTPCVFPMVPMTVSFFMKQQKGKFKALAYGIFIVLLYTFPICIVIGITLATGGEAVTADIFNWLSTHWIPNILFFVIFMVFAASFFGAFEITLPSKWVNSSDRNKDKKGLGGVFFLALTLVLVSFSCTGPIVGTVLIKSTQGEFWTPMVTMLFFSVAFALPFVILALFPSLLNRIPKSGGWLNSVKVVLGFIEIALGLKFLSTADQTYHWGLLDREVYLAVWIVCFTLLGLYLLGKIRFRNDSPLEYISVKRLVLVIADFAFVVYLIPGMWGAPLKALSGYLPPLETQDFVIGNNVTVSGDAVQKTAAVDAADGMLTLAHGIVAYPSVEEGLEAASREGKPLFVDVTGLACVNCREMEARVWSNPEVLALLKNNFVVTALVVDDKTPLPQDKWVTASSGKVLKDVGRVNSLVARERFGVNAQPNYIILNPEGGLVAGPRGYDLSVDDYLAFLKSAL